MKAWRKIGRKEAAKFPQFQWPKHVLMAPLLSHLLVRAGVYEVRLDR
jgi:hypothetical protein